MAVPPFLLLTASASILLPSAENPASRCSEKLVRSHWKETLLLCHLWTYPSLPSFLPTVGSPASSRTRWVSCIINSISRLFQGRRFYDDTLCPLGAHNAPLASFSSTHDAGFPVPRRVHNTSSHSPPSPGWLCLLCPSANRLESPTAGFSPPSLLDPVYLCIWRHCLLLARSPTTGLLEPTPSYICICVNLNAVISPQTPLVSMTHPRLAFFRDC